jgi:hypothetical protein
VRRRLRRCATAGLTAAATGLLVAVVVPPASAGSERMQLTCQGGPDSPDVRVIERTNGSSWWGVGSDVGYVSERLLITDGDEVLYAKDYGRKAPDADRSICVADHFGSTWTVDLVRTR